MTIKEARQAVVNRTIIQFIEEPNLWGIPTCLSDDETTIYYKPRGMNWFRGSATIEKIEKG
jgi:hypothetical protein